MSINTSKQLKLGAILSYLAIAINVISGLVYTPWMINQIGQSQYGIYTLATSLITLFMFDFGLSSTASKYISNCHAVNDEEGANRALGIIYKLYLVVDAIIFVVLLVLFFLLDSIYVKLTPVEIEQFKIAYVIVAAYSIISFPFVTLNGVLTAYEKFIHIKIAEIIYRIVVVGLMIGALLLGMGLYALVTVNAVAGLIIIFYKLIAIKKTTPIKANFRVKDSKALKEMLKFSLWITIHSLAQRLIFNITPSILGIVADSKAIAIFGVVTTIEAYVYLIATALNGMFMPKISRILQGKDNDKSTMPLMLNIGLFQYVVNCIIVIGFICVGKDFILLWMGQDYMEAYIGIVLVIVPGIFYNPLQIAHTAMMVEGKAKQLAFINVVAGVINIILSVFMSKLFGVIGACISIMIAYFVRNILVFIIYPKNMDINLKMFTKEIFIKPLLPTVACLAIGLIINYFFIADSWLKLIGKGVSVLAVMVIVILGYYMIRKYFIHKRGENNGKEEGKN